LDEKELEDAWDYFKKDKSKDKEPIEDVLKTYYPDNPEMQKKLFFAIYELYPYVDKKSCAVDADIAIEIFKKHGVAEVLEYEIMKVKVRKLLERLFGN